MRSPGQRYAYSKVGYVLLGELIAQLSARSRASLLSPVAAPGPRRRLGWFAGTLDRRAWLAQAGGGAGYCCEARLYPALGCVSAVMFNRTGLRDERILDRIDQHLISGLG